MISSKPCVHRETISMKVSITYLYTITKYGYPPSIEDDFKALADIERLGFHLMAATTPL